MNDVLSDKLTEYEMQDLTRLAQERTVDALEMVLGLIDDPGQVAEICACVAGSMIHRAAMFKHTSHVLEGRDKPHKQIVAEVVFSLTEFIKAQEPTNEQRDEMLKLRNRRLRRRH